jgi:deoxyhypusine synthase
MASISEFLETNFRHFNARETLDAARAWKRHVESGGKMLLAMAGAMSTAEIGRSLARMIRQDKVHIISCTAANLEEDIYNLVAHDHYKMLPHYRDLTPREEKELYEKGFNRVTDTCIPEEEAFRVIGRALLPRLARAEAEGTRAFPHEYFYEMIRGGDLAPHYQIDPRDSWVVAACERNLPLLTPGYEDCTTANIIVSWVMSQKLGGFGMIKSGFEQMQFLANWYLETTRQSPVGFFQIGGGIAGDFPICAVPMMIQDLEWECPFWSYFAQIGDSTTSFGSYSGAVPNEKITWGKLDEQTPKFMINSDASIVAPLVFAYVLGE